jgi:hypothetical protein
MRALCWLCLCLLAAGCASDVANRYYVSEKFPEREVKDVELLRARPTREYVVIADFQSRGESPESIRKKAAKVGADAVIISLLGGQYSLSEQWAGDGRRSDTYTRITGTAIRYKRD